jgi:hypothetical protein
MCIETGAQELSSSSGATQSRRMGFTFDYCLDSVRGKEHAAALRLNRIGLGAFL